MPDDILEPHHDQSAREPAGVPDAAAADVAGTAQGMTPKALWTLAITSTAVFMVTLDNLVVTTAIPVLRVDLHASLSGLGVDGQRVYAHVRGAAVDRGGVGRPLRAPPAARDRHRDLHVGIRGGRAGPLDCGARRRAGGPGRGRRDRDAADADRPVC